MRERDIPFMNPPEIQILFYTMPEIDTGKFEPGFPFGIFPKSTAFIKCAEPFKKLFSYACSRKICGKLCSEQFILPVCPRFIRNVCEVPEPAEDDVAFRMLHHIIHLKTQLLRIPEIVRIQKCDQISLCLRQRIIACF